MLIRIPKLLGPPQVQELLQMANAGRFVPVQAKQGGPRSRRGAEDMLATPEQSKRIDSIVLGALQAREEFRSYAVPKRLLSVRLQRSRPGMQPRPAVEKAIVGSANPVRSDLALALFLSDPDSYEGGELKLKTAYGTESLKEPAGDALIYPAVLPQWIEPVGRGERVAAVTFVESHVSDPLQRQLLYELKMVMTRVWAQSPGSEEADMLSAIHSNLSRMWLDA
jgi:PKHD-type hydroxylase